MPVGIKISDRLGLQPFLIKKGQIFLFTILCFSLIYPFFSASQPYVTVRFANPNYNCLEQTYSLDVEFQSDTPGQQLHGMNVRFFYDDLVLEYDTMLDFEYGYSAVNPLPPEISTGMAGSGTLLFGFPDNHPFEYFNAAIQLTGTSSMALSTNGWTRIFSISFHVDDPSAIGVGSFCPVIVWDLQDDASGGGFLPGDEGIVMTLSAPPPAFSTLADEGCIHHNWTFDATPDQRPYGLPVPALCIPTTGIAASATAVNASCYGGNTGFATALPSGGKAPYSYLWSTGGNSATITGLGAGTYSVTVTDANQCSATAEATVSQPEELVAGMVNENQLVCENASPLPLTASPPAGESGNYLYQWEMSDDSLAWQLIAGATGLTFNPSPADHDRWFRQIQSDVLCGSSVATLPVKISITPSAVVFAGDSVTLCGAAPVGLSQATVSNAVSYAWSTSGTGYFDHQTNLNPVYFPSQEDFQSGCVSLILTAVSSAPCPTVSDTMSLCFSSPPIADAGPGDSVCSGAPYQILGSSASSYSQLTWTTSGSGIFSDPHALHPVYTPSSGDILQGFVMLYLQVTALSPCDDVVDSMWLGMSGSLNAGIALLSGVSCHGLADGALQMNVSGGTTPYGFEWSNGVTLAVNSNLAAGPYSVTVTDFTGCSAVRAGWVPEPDEITLSGIATSETCYGYQNGTIETTVSGGTPAYSYTWSNGETSENLYGLSPGIYSLTITDDHQCEATGSWEITGNPSWSVEISGPMAACENSDNNQYCAVINDPGHPGAIYTYQWAVVGGIITGGQNTQCINLTWLPCTSGTVVLVVTREEDGCSTPVFIDVMITPVPEPLISGAIQTATGDTVQYCTSNTEGHLYSWSVQGGSILSGQGTNCITVVWGPYPSCGCGEVRVYESFQGCTGSYWLPVNLQPGSSFSISGYLSYDNAFQTKINYATIQLKAMNGTVVATTHTINHPVTGTPGYFTFSGLADSTYRITGSYSGEWGGNNATDALIAELNIIGSAPLSGLRLLAANVNGSMYPVISGLDALYIKLRTVGAIYNYPADDWVISDTVVTYSGTPLSVGLTGICRGDINGSFVPGGYKESTGIHVISQVPLEVPQNQPFEYEITTSDALETGALTLYMTFDESSFEILEIISHQEGMESRIGSGSLAIAWTDTKTRYLEAGESIVKFLVRAKQKLSQPVPVFNIAGGSEFAASDASRLEGVNLGMADVFTAQENDGFSFSNFPNPFRSETRISCILPVEGFVHVVIHDLAGNEIETIASEWSEAGLWSGEFRPSSNLSAGVYFCRIVFSNSHESTVKSIKIVHIK
jgi:hypothetical protein